MAKHYVYKFYAELRDYEPKIWRRFKIVGSKTMAELGYTLMVLFEMRGSHLFCFTMDEQTPILDELKTKYPTEDVDAMWEKYKGEDWTKISRYELESDDEMFVPNDQTLLAADRVILNKTTLRAGRTLNFEYDYGDGWEIALSLESVEKKEVALTTLPCVTEGAGFGIIEDIGGAGGLEGFAMAMKKGSGHEYEEYCEWLGVDSFDMTKFDMDDLNFRLKKLVRVYKEAYEYGYEPTKKSIDIIERKYLL